MPYYAYTVKNIVSIGLAELSYLNCTATPPCNGTVNPLDNAVYYSSNLTRMLIDMADTVIYPEAMTSDVDVLNSTLTSYQGDLDDIYSGTANGLMTLQVGFGIMTGIALVILGSTLISSLYRQPYNVSNFVDAMSRPAVFLIPTILSLCPFWLGPALVIWTASQLMIVYRANKLLDVSFVNQAVTILFDNVLDQTVADREYLVLAVQHVCGWVITLIYYGCLAYGLGKYCLYAWKDRASASDTETYCYWKNRASASDTETYCYTERAEPKMYRRYDNEDSFA